jgi:WD40 repeat protein
MALAAWCGLAGAKETRVVRLRMTQPFMAGRPFMTDTTDVNGQAWNLGRTLMDNSVSPQAWRQGTETEDSILPAPGTDVVRLAGFTVQNESFAKLKVKVEGLKDFQIYVDGQLGGEQNLVPGRHDVVLKIHQVKDETDTLRVTIDSEQRLQVNPSGKEPYTLKTLMYGERMAALSVSPDGRFLTLDKTLTHTDAKSDRTKYLIDLQTGQRTVVSDFRQWTSTGHSYIAGRTRSDMATEYEVVDAQTFRRTPLFTDLQNQSGWFLPGERQMLIYKQTEGPKEDPEVFQVLTPDDRQPGWRNRSNIQLMDVATGQIRPITLGQHSVGAEMSPDGKRMLLHIYEYDITHRPFTFTTALILDLQTMQADTLYAHDGFASQGRWSPDGKYIVFQGSPEAFGGIGNRVPKGMTPSMIETDLFRMDLATKQVTPLTADFDPNISSWQWSKADGMIYALCENRDNQDIFRIDPQSGKYEMLPLSERFITRFDSRGARLAFIYRTRTLEQRPPIHLRPC